MSAWIQIEAGEWARKALRAVINGDRGATKRLRGDRFCKAAVPLRHGDGHYSVVSRTLDGFMLEHRESGKRCEVTASELDIAKGGRGLGLWVEIPGDVYRALADTVIAKAATHRFLKKVPTGKRRMRKDGTPGGMIYRYYYKLGGPKAHIGHEDHFVVGTMLKHGAGHYHIVEDNGGRLKLRHDETGDTQTLTRAELRVMLEDHHKGAIDAHAATKAARRQSEHERAQKHGSPKQRARAAAAAGVKELTAAELRQRAEADAAAAAKARQEHAALAAQAASAAAARVDADAPPAQPATATLAEPRERDLDTGAAPAQLVELEPFKTSENRPPNFLGLKREMFTFTPFKNGPYTNYRPVTVFRPIGSHVEELIEGTVSRKLLEAAQLIGRTMVSDQAIAGSIRKYGKYKLDKKGISEALGVKEDFFAGADEIPKRPEDIAKEVDEAENADFAAWLERQPTGGAPAAPAGLMKGQYVSTMDEATQLLLGLTPVGGVYPPDVPPERRAVMVHDLTGFLRQNEIRVPQWLAREVPAKEEPPAGALAKALRRVASRVGHDAK